MKSKLIVSLSFSQSYNRTIYKLLQQPARLKMYMYSFAASGAIGTANE
jgi:hypothetical protein